MKEEVIELMKSSENLNQWNKNCRKVKEAFGDEYPDFCRKDIIMSGLALEIMSRFNRDAKLHIL